jgi:hypothetical protein
MKTNMNRLLHAGLITLCCTFAVWATADRSAHAAPPALGGMGGHHGNNGRNAFGGTGGWGGWGGGELFGFELNGDENRIPFYAAHPPVYYSYPIARPYGDSPFPSPPTYFGPLMEDSGPRTIINPYAQPGNAAPSNTAPSNAAPTVPTPAPPAPTMPSPNNVKPTAGRTASLDNGSMPSFEALPSPGPVSSIDSDSTAATGVHVVLNPYVK